MGIEHLKKLSDRLKTSHGFYASYFNGLFITAIFKYPSFGENANAVMYVKATPKQIREKLAGNSLAGITISPFSYSVGTESKSLMKVEVKGKIDELLSVEERFNKIAEKIKEFKEDFNLTFQIANPSQVDLSGYEWIEKLWDFARKTGIRINVPLDSRAKRSIVIAHNDFHVRKMLGNWEFPLENYELQMPSEGEILFMGNKIYAVTPLMEGMSIREAIQKLEAAKIYVSLKREREMELSV